MAGRLVSGSSCVPVLLHFTHCRLRGLGRGGLLANGGSLALADALPLVGASSLADALPLFLYSGRCFAAVVVLFGRCLATVSCFVLALPWHLWRQYFVQVLLFGWPLSGWLVWSVLPRASSAVRLLCSGYGHFVYSSVLFLQCFFILSSLCFCIG